MAFGFLLLLPPDLIGETTMIRSAVLMLSGP